jgi:hypothetical protein
LGILSGDVYPLHATGYFHKNAATFSRRIDTEAVWTSSQPGVASVAGGNVLGGSAGGPAAIAAVMGGTSDTARVTVWPKPAFIQRINFQISATPWSYGWLADNGAAYAAAQGYGWVGSSFNPANDAREDRLGTNFLLKSFINANRARYSYKVNCPDGDYIIKAAAGDNQYGSTDSVWYGTDVVLSHSGQSNGIAVDTVTVTGGNGLVLTIKAVINYLVVISKEGIDINQVADDGGNAVPVPPGSGIETAVRLAQKLTISVYPNPFQSAATIRFGVSAGSDMPSHLMICDIRGRVVAETGPHGLRTARGEFAWDASRLPAGVYIIKAVMEKNAYYQKAILTR